MFQTAFAVMLGILSAVAVLKWWESRHERRAARAYRKSMRQAELAARVAELEAQEQARRDAEDARAEERVALMLARDAQYLHTVQEKHYKRISSPRAEWIGMADFVIAAAVSFVVVGTALSFFVR